MLLASTSLNAVAAAFLVPFLVTAFGITYWAAMRSHSRSDFYAAGRPLSSLEGGLALSGAFLCAGSFLGVAGMVAAHGFSALVFALGLLAGWPIILMLISGPLRDRGGHTIADAIAHRLRPRPVRVAAGATALVTITLCLVAETIATGNLLRASFGLPYETGVALLMACTTVFVFFGGMLATSWIQIVGAIVIIGGATLFVVFAFAQSGVSISSLLGAFREAVAAARSRPLAWETNPVGTFSTALALAFGTAGLPQVSMRILTAFDRKTARRSVCWAMFLVGYLLTLAVAAGLCTRVLGGTAAATEPDGALTVLYLASGLGGNLFLGFFMAASCAAAVAVTVGPTLAGATALSHDLYAGVFRRGRATDREELRAARVATAVVGLLAVLLALVFRERSALLLLSLAFAVAASTNFPALLLAVCWRRYTTRGAVASIGTGLIVSVTLIALGPAARVRGPNGSEGGAPRQAFESHRDRGAAASEDTPDYRNPALFSTAAAFLAGIVFSVRKPEEPVNAEIAGETTRSRAEAGEPGRA